MQVVNRFIQGSFLFDVSTFLAEYTVNGSEKTWEMIFDLAPGWKSEL